MPQIQFPITDQLLAAIRGANAVSPESCSQGLQAHEAMIGAMMEAIAKLEMRIVELEVRTERRRDSP